MANPFTAKDCWTPAGDLVEISPLDDICTLDCELAAVPFLPLNPDNAAIQLPAITPRVSPGVSRVSGCARSSGPSTTETGSQDVTSITPLSDSWTSPSLVGDPEDYVSLKDTRMTRMAITSTLMVAFFRTYYYDTCGGLIYVTPENGQDASDIGPC